MWEEAIVFAKKFAPEKTEGARAGGDVRPDVDAEDGSDGGTE